MKGPFEVLVDINSATQSRGAWESKPYFLQAVNRSHSDIVKYSPEDECYKLVKGRLEEMRDRAVRTIHGRFKAQSVSGKQVLSWRRTSK